MVVKLTDLETSIRSIIKGNRKLAKLMKILNQSIRNPNLEFSLSSTLLILGVYFQNKSPKFLFILLIVDY